MSVPARLSSYFGRVVALTVICLSIGLTIDPAKAADPVGDTERVVNNVTGAGTVGKRKLAVKDPVYRNDTINAAAASHGELLLRDGSHVIVGEKSTVSLDDFVVSGSSFSSGTVKVTKGAFRFISGNSGKEAISIETPRASIGIRGTLVDVYVDPVTGVTRTILISGEITACTKGRIRKCETIRRSCDILEIDGDEIKQLPFLHSSAWTAEEEARLFGLTGNQQNFLPEWRAFEGGCFARAAEEARSKRPPDQGAGNVIPPYIPPQTPPVTPPFDECDGPCG